MAVEVAKCLRLEVEKPVELAAAWKDIHSFYFDLPSKPEFAAVEKRHFAEVQNASV